MVPLRERERKRIELSSPDWLAAAAGALWVKNDGGEVVRINPKVGEVVARIPPPTGSGFCQGFGAAHGAVYSCPYQGVIQKIDVDSNRITDEIRIAMLGDQGHLETASGRLWLITASARAIRGINVEDGEVGPPIKLGAFCTELAAADTTVWAACPTDGLLVRVNTESGEVTGRLKFRDIRQVAVDESVWVGYSDGVAQVDPETLEVQVLYDAQIGLFGSIYANDDTVLVRSEGEPFLIVINPTTRTVIETIIAPDLPSGGNAIRIGDSWWASAYDDKTLVQIEPTS